MIARLGPALVAAALITVPFATGLTAAQAAPPTTIALADHTGGDQDQGQDQGQWPGQGQSQWPGQGQNQWPGQGQNEWPGQGQRQPQDEGDWWFNHHCRELHEWWQARCQRDGGDMWHRGDPPSLGY
ncbi:hypothetical protein ACFXHA_35635 [Nocardia sp. NPDC059240]|uniref:hypothetical protein n=1 Tax=Nocardia sp. NPDC059240 TaxID=3346786 RepID=UPI0036C995DB